MVQEAEADLPPAPQNAADDHGDGTGENASLSAACEPEHDKDYHPIQITKQRQLEEPEPASVSSKRPRLEAPASALASTSALTPASTFAPGPGRPPLERIDQNSLPVEEQGGGGSAPETIVSLAPRKATATTDLVESLTVSNNRILEELEEVKHRLAQSDERHNKRDREERKEKDNSKLVSATIQKLEMMVAARDRQLDEIRRENAHIKTDLGRHEIARLRLEETVKGVKRDIAKLQQAFDEREERAGDEGAQRQNGDPRHAQTPDALKIPLRLKKIVHETFKKLAPLVDSDPLPARFPELDPDLVSDDRPSCLHGEWLPDFSLTVQESPVNARFARAVLDKMEEDTQPTSNTYSPELKSRAIDSHFLTLHVRYGRQLAEESTARSRRDLAPFDRLRRRRARKTTKCRIRTKLYDAQQQEALSNLDTAHQQGALSNLDTAHPLTPFLDPSFRDALNPDYMSSEESEVDSATPWRSKPTTTLAVVRPSYRSHKLKKFFKTLDAFQDTSRRHIPRREKAQAEDRVPPEDASWWMISHKYHAELNQPSSMKRKTYRGEKMRDADSESEQEIE
ncbi:uncharacterized protein JCM15063_004310 [Sporobolomyces koalae]|uniref:uncharacterized protein n=1 Tax=Sporobolomyces koalae TaxID=500713 RepID=UPI00317F8996